VSNWKPIRPFDIDDGQLECLSPQECFVLGYELAQVDALLSTGERFSKMIHSANLDRVKIVCVTFERSFAAVYSADDQSESWVTINVGPGKPIPLD
jgi:hypothetical protein